MKQNVVTIDAITHDRACSQLHVQCGGGFPTQVFLDAVTALLAQVIATSVGATLGNVDSRFDDVMEDMERAARSLAKQHLSGGTDLSYDYRPEAMN